MTLEILQPAAVLVIWSLIMMGWMAATRLPAMKKIGLDLSKAAPGGRGVDIDPVVPPKVAWKSHNYTHLMEQPTIFYPTVVILAICGAGTAPNLYLAWGYVILRIIHSIYQVTINNVNIRFVIFLLSSICLMALAISALTVVFSL